MRWGICRNSGGGINILINAKTMTSAGSGYSIIDLGNTGKNFTIKFTLSAFSGSGYRRFISSNPEFSTSVIIRLDSSGKYEGSLAGTYFSSTATAVVGDKIVIAKSGATYTCTINGTILKTATNTTVIDLKNTYIFCNKGSEEFFTGTLTDFEIKQ